MYICEDCGAVFYTLPKKTGCVSDEILNLRECPSCGGDLLETANCVSCGEFVQNVHGSRVLCDDCVKENTTWETVTDYAKGLKPENAVFDKVSINPIFGMFFDEQDINRLLWQALLKHTAHYTKHALDAYAADFVSGDRSNFEEWLIERK